MKGGTGLGLVAVCLVLTLLNVDLPITQALHSFPVYRLLQHHRPPATSPSPPRETPPGSAATQEQGAGSVQEYGSQQTNVHLPACAPAENVAGAEVSRCLAILSYSQLLHDEAGTEKLVGSGAGVLVLLPPRDQVLDREDVKKWAALERQLLHRRIPGPFYFAVTDEKIEGSLPLISTSTSTSGTRVGGSAWEFAHKLVGDDYVLTITAPEPTPIKEKDFFNIQGWLPTGAGSESESAPTIAVVAHYDTFGIAPDIATGGDANGSGVVALLELARLFHKLYSNPRTQGKYNLLFVLTAAGRHNFAGTRAWLQNLEARLASSIDFALCLDSIGSDDVLHVHVSRPPKDPKIRSILAALNASATDSDVQLEVAHRKINTASGDVLWEHEPFSYKRIVAATLSHVKEPSPSLFSRSNILDSRASVNTTVLRSNIKLIAEALARYIYSTPETTRGASVFEGSLELHEAFIRTWQDTLERFPRVHPFLAKDSPLLLTLEKTLGEFTEVTRVSGTLDHDVTFYRPSSGTMTAHRVKPVLFDVILTVGIAIYLVTLYVSLKGARQTWKQVKILLEGKKESKKKKQ